MIIDCKELENITSNKNLDSLLKEAFFIDIETTGLSREYSSIISITIMLYEDNCYKIYQLFCQYKIDEPEVLKHIKDLVKNKKYIITYNGNTFDIPFLASKSKKHNINIDFNNFIKIDLYNWVRSLKNKIEIDNYKLKTVEEFFNIKRHDTLSGEDIITLYEAYVIHPKKEFAFLIMQHNLEDVFNLSLLLENILNMYDDILYYNNYIVIIDNVGYKIKKNALFCKFNVVSDLNVDYIHSHINFNLKVNSAAQTMELEIPLGFYKDERIKEFYFIDNNDYNVKSYTGIEGIKKNLMPIKFNDKMFYNNILNVVKNILDSLF